MERLESIPLDAGLLDPAEGSNLDDVEEEDDETSTSLVAALKDEEEREDDDVRAHWSHHIEFLQTSIVGMLIAVSWAYLLQQQVDPNDECPGDHCWILVVVLAANMLAGVLYIPAVSLALVRRLGRSDRVLFELEAHTGTRRGLSFRRAVTRRLQRLATDASATCWSVTASSFVYFTLKQLEFVASGGDSSNFVRPVEHAGDTAARRHLIHHRFAVLSACFGVCLGVVCVSLVTMILATRKLATETRPLFLEVWLLLRSGLYYSCAFAIATFIGLLFFSPFELDWGGKVVRLFAALARAFGLVVLARSIVRRLPVPPSDDSIAFAEASTHWTACANLFCFNVSSVVAAIGIHDAVVFFLVDVLSLSRWRRIAVLFTYAIALISFVLRRRTLEAKRRAEMDPASCNHLAEFRSCNSPSDLAFLNVLERWLVCFAWWVPYKYFFVEAWDVLGVRGTPPSRSGSHLFVYLVRRFGRLLWQILIAVFFTACFAVLTSLPNFMARLREEWLRPFNKCCRISRPSRTEGPRADGGGNEHGLDFPDSTLPISQLELPAALGAIRTRDRRSRPTRAFSV